MPKPLAPASLAAAWLAGALATAAAQTNIAISVNDAGDFANGPCDGARISGDGRYAVFSSRATNLAPGSVGSFDFVFRHDLVTKTTDIVSVLPDGTPADRCFWPDISDDGRYVTFAGARDDLVAGDTNDRRDIFLRDMVTGTTELVSKKANGMPSDASSARPRISGNGRYVAFDSDAQLDVRDLNNNADIYRYDRLSGAIEYVSVTQSGIGADSWSIDVDICDSGEALVFRSAADNLGTTAPSEVNIYLKDMTTGEIRQIDHPTILTGSTLGAAWPAISGSGQVVAFWSSMIAPVGGIFAYDVATDSVERLSLTPSGQNASGNLSSPMGISFRGRFVTFSADSDDLLPGGNGFSEEIYLRDRLTDTTERISVGWGGGPINREACDPHIDHDGHTVVFTSRALNLIQGMSSPNFLIYGRNLLEDIGTTYCSAAPNSTSVTSTIDALGFSAVNRNEVVLRASRLPASVLTFFLASLSEGFLANPGGSAGNLCLGGFIGRYIRPGEVLDSGLFGDASLRIDLADVPQPSGSLVVLPGTSVYFQGWHRDAVGGVNTSNFTPGLRIDFE